MRYWPVPDFPPSQLPDEGEPGSFWEDRGDRRHAGIDLYAPAGSPVLAVEGGVVAAVKEFTSPASNPYWNRTYSILIQSDAGQYHRYAELDAACIETGQRIEAGSVIGSVGTVLALDRVDLSTPVYIQRLKLGGRASMLHFEIHTCQPLDGDFYLGGNYFLDEPPDGLLNPRPYLQEVLQDQIKTGVLH